jgi:hypothetical protein
MNTRWHLRQLRRRETPEFELDRSVALWGRDAPAGEGGASTAVAAARPATPVFSLTESQLDSLPEVMSLPSAGTRIGDIEIAFGQEYLVLQDITTLFLIRDNLGKRPIYFAWSTGGYADQTFGLTSYLVSQGLVRRLEPRQVVESDSVRLVPGLGYLDVPRTRRLLWEVYHWRSAARERPRGWVDAPSSSILTLYQIVYSAGADALRRVGLPGEAARADSIADAVQANIGRDQQSP